MKNFLFFILIFFISFFFVACSFQGAHKYSGKYKDHSIMTSQIRIKLLEDPITDLSHIDVTSKDGVVTLSGFVVSEEEKQRAALLAGEISGVKKVINNLVIE